MHKTQTLLRHLPESARKKLDRVSGLAPWPGLLFESTDADLKEAMTEAGVDKALVIAHPPVISNEAVLDACSHSPNLIPVVNIAKGIPRSSITLKKLHLQGAKLLKIHPPADGEGPKSSRYRNLLDTASELGMPVIIHTGCMHVPFVYKNSEMGRAEAFSPWFSSYPKTQFILAHMNFHEPEVAIDLCEKFENIYIDTSWQPAEVIGEAVRRLGSSRILFATDWPFVGNNFMVGIRRIEECVEAGLMTENQSSQILGGNAATLLGLY